MWAPDAKTLDGARARRTLTHRLETTLDSVLHPVPSPVGCSLSALLLGSDVGCAPGENIGALRVPESSRALRLLRLRVVVLLAWLQLLLPPGSVACASSAAAAAALCAPAQTAVRRRASRVECASASRQE
jgi:hypothetical protein